LQQTPAGFAKEFPHNSIAKADSVAVLQQGRAIDENPRNSVVPAYTDSS